MTLDQWKRLMGDLSRVITRNQNSLLLLGGKNLEGRMKQRIFNKGRNSNEQAIGQYKSKWWKKVRREGSKKNKQKGRQIGYVDLEYTGELRNSIQVVKDGPGVALVVVNDHNFDKAMGQQLIQGRKAGKSEMIIFEPSQKEETAVQNYINDLIDEIIDDTLKNFT